MYQEAKMPFTAQAKVTVPAPTTKPVQPAATIPAPTTKTAESKAPVPAPQ